MGLITLATKKWRSILMTAVLIASTFVAMAASADSENSNEIDYCKKPEVILRALKKTFGIDCHDASSRLFESVTILDIDFKSDLEVEEFKKELHLFSELDSAFITFHGGATVSSDSLDFRSNTKIGRLFLEFKAQSILSDSIFPSMPNLFSIIIVPGDGLLIQKGAFKNLVAMNTIIFEGQGRIEIEDLAFTDLANLKEVNILGSGLKFVNTNRAAFLGVLDLRGLPPSFDKGVAETQSWD